MPMDSTTIYECGSVVVVNVPFSNQVGAKPRPALVVSTEAFHAELPDVIVCPISSQPRHQRQPGAAGYVMKHWKTVGLRHPSTVRISNLVTLEKTSIKRILGRCHDDDLWRVQQLLSRALGLPDPAHPR